jgi:hypothetical protein
MGHFTSLLTNFLPLWGFQGATLLTVEILSWIPAAGGHKVSAGLDPTWLGGTGSYQTCCVYSKKVCICLVNPNVTRLPSIAAM